MKYIASYSHEPADNLAYEEYLLENIVNDEPLLFLYINKPSVIIGKHQNAYEQVNFDYLFNKNITLVRRMSGGGAVYHDYGNLNYSFILPSKEKMLDFKELTKPIIAALRKMGACDISLSGRNDLEINGLKVSGTAMYQKGEHILLHGTLLYNSELSKLNDILKVKKNKIESKGVKSVRARVTNICGYLKEEYQNLSTKEFMNKLLEFMPNVSNYKNELSIKELLEINDIKTKYYTNMKWIYGLTPKFTYKNSKKYSFGEVEIAIKTEKSIVKDFKIYGDYFAKEDIDTLEEKFVNLPYDKKIFELNLEKINLENYLPSLSKEEFLKLCFEN